MSRDIIIELAWVFIALATSLCFNILLFGLGIFNGQVDIHLHDTYFVMPATTVVSVCFLFVLFLLFYFRNKRLRYRNKFGNWLLIVSGVFLVIGLNSLADVFQQYSAREWTIYPPISTVDGFPSPAALSKSVANVLNGVLLVVLLMCVSAAYKWGKEER